MIVSWEICNSKSTIGEQDRWVCNKRGCLEFLELLQSQRQIATSCDNIIASCDWSSLGVNHQLTAFGVTLTEKQKLGKQDLS